MREASLEEPLVLVQPLLLELHVAAYIEHHVVPIRRYV